MTFSTTGVVAAADADTKRGPAALLVFERVFREAALLPDEKPTRPSGLRRVGRLAAAMGDGHQERRTGSPQITDHVDGVKLPVQQQETDFHAQGTYLLQQMLEGLLERFALADPPHRQREPLSLLDDVAAGIGVKMGRAPLRLRSNDFVGIAKGFAVIRDQGQVDGQPLRPLGQPPRQLGRQPAVDSPLEGIPLRQHGNQRIADRLVGGRLAQPPASVEYRPHPRGGKQQNIDQHRRPAFGSMIPNLEMILDQRRRVGVHRTHRNAIVRP